MWLTLFSKLNLAIINQTACKPQCHLERLNVLSRKTPMSPVAFVNYAIQVAEALSVMVQKKKKKRMKCTSALPKAKQKRFVWILMSVKLARDQTHGVQHRLIGPSNRLRWIWLKPKMPARSRPYGGAKKADKSSRTTAIVFVCIGLFIAQLVCDSQNLRRKKKANSTSCTATALSHSWSWCMSDDWCSRDCWKFKNQSDGCIYLSAYNLPAPECAGGCQRAT